MVKERRKGQYVVVDFDNVTDRGLKKLTDALKRANAPVADIEASNRKIKKDSLYVKRAKLFFESGQQVTLFIGDQGDIYQMVINGKKTPLPNANDERKFATELAKTLSRTQAAFDDSQLKKVSRPKNTSQAAPATRSLKKRAEEARQHISALTMSKGELVAQLTEKQAKNASAGNKEQQLKVLLETEKKETATLKAELKELQESIK